MQETKCLIDRRGGICCSVFVFCCIIRHILYNDCNTAIIQEAAIMTYLLMNKDNIVAEIRETEGIVSEEPILSLSITFGSLPIGMSEIESWISARQASKHNAHLQRLMVSLGCNTKEGFIATTHAASINDTFWVKRDDEAVEWKDVSLYANQFTDTISKLAFEGVGLAAETFSSTSPELTCDGSFRKCFRKEDGLGQFGSDIFLYKRAGEIGEQIEPYCEAIASEIAAVICGENSVQYQAGNLHGRLASRCNLFTNEELGYASIAKVFRNAEISAENALRYFSSIGCEEQFREMVVTDSICFNLDRHAGNYGVLFDNDTLQVKQMAPVFDMNLSLLCNVPESGLDHVGDALYGCSPKIGSDFTRTGQLMLTDSIRERVKELQDFEFSFCGDNKFSEKRVRKTEEIIQKQSSAILSNQKLMLKDVFFSAQAERALAEARERKIRETIVADFVDLVQDIADQYGLIAGPGDTENGLTCILENQSMSLIVDFERGGIEVENNGHIVNLGAVSAEDGDIIPIYNAVLQKFCEYAGRTEMQEYPAPQYSPAREERERYFDDFER